MFYLQYVAVEVVLDDGVLHALHGNLQEICVRSISIVHVDFPIRCSIEPSKLICEILRPCIDILGGSRVIGKEVTNGLLDQLRLEQIDLIEEEDD